MTTRVAIEPEAEAELEEAADRCEESVNGLGLDFLAEMRGRMQEWLQAGDVTSVQGEASRLAEDTLDVVLATRGTLNFNDALLVVLRREGVIDSVASFDQGSNQVEGFGRIE